MSDQEPRDNWDYVCPIHASRPQPALAALPAASFIGRYVKRAFAVRGAARLEHMWIRVDRVTVDGHLQGRLDNDPVYDCGVVCGDRVTVALADIEAVLD
jgi:Uncharacterized protein conserved in bacteria (DUF2314)